MTKQKNGYYIEYKLTSAPNAVLVMNIDSSSKDGAKQKLYKHFGGSKNAQILHINQHGEIDAMEEAIRAEAESQAAEAEVQEILAEAEHEPEQPQAAPSVEIPEIGTALLELKKLKNYTQFADWAAKYAQYYRLFRIKDGEAVDTHQPYKGDGTVVTLNLANGAVSRPFARVIHRYFELVQV